MGNRIWTFYKEIPLDDSGPKNETSVVLEPSSKMISHVKAALLAQLLSLTIAGTGVVNDQLFEKFNINIPTFQSSFNYALLALIFVPLWASTASKEGQNLWQVIKTRGWKYFLVSVADVEANFFMVKAYSMTIITTIQVIDAFILPITVLLSFVLLKHSFRVNQLLGVFGALLGCGLIIVADSLVKNTEDLKGNHMLLGDALCLISSVLYAASNVAAEYFIKENSKREYLSMIGIFGTVVSCLQMFVLEKGQILNLLSANNYKLWFLFSLNSVLMFSIYAVIPCVLEMSSAAFLNVNLLTADFYSVIFGIFIKKYQLHLLYFFGFGCIAIGTILYSLSSSSEHKSKKPAAAQTRNLDEQFIEMKF